MVNCKHLLVAAGLCLGFSVGTAFADASALDKLAGAKEAIMGYYAANGREPNCGAGHMESIGDAKLVSESGDTAVVAVSYAFSATPGAGGTQCSGDSSREFTLTKGSSGWAVTGMTGQNP